MGKNIPEGEGKRGDNKQRRGGERDDSHLKDLLKSAGYFDNRLEGFFLKSLIRKGSAFLHYLLTSLKVGFALGFLFAVLFTAAVVYFNPAFRGKFNDTLLLAFYFWIIFTLTLSIFALVLGSMISFLQRYFKGKAGKVNVASLSALITSTVVFGYLSVWWIKASSSAEVSGTGLRDLIALIVIFLLSFGIGRVVFYGGVALLKRNQIDIEIGGFLRFRRKHLLAAAMAGLLFFSFLFFLVGTTIVRRGNKASSDYTIVYPDYKVVLIAIDGLDRKLSQRLVKTGKLPLLSSLMSKAVVGDFSIGRQFVPPVFWTTVATGVNPVQHGIGDISVHRLAGVSTPLQTSLGEPVLSSVIATLVPSAAHDSAAPITANLRRSKAFWNILNDKTLPVGIVNWWATWPCEPVNGFIVSERLLYKLDKKEKLENDVEPGELFGKIQEMFGGLRAEFEESFRNIFEIDKQSGEENELYRIVKEAAWIDFFHSRLFLRLYKDYEVKMTALYLPGADIVQSRLLGGERFSSLDDLKSRLDLIEKYCVFLDSTLSWLKEAAFENDYILLLATPGREVGGIPSSGDHKLGFYIFKGPDAILRNPPPPITYYDVAPTLLYLLGFPQSEDFIGSPVVELFKQSLRARLKTNKIESFGDRVSGLDEHIDSQFSREVLEQLRNLGYIN